MSQGLANIHCVEQEGICTDGFFPQVEAIIDDLEGKNIPYVLVHFYCHQNSRLEPTFKDIMINNAKKFTTRAQGNYYFMMANLTTDNGMASQLVFFEQDFIRELSDVHPKQNPIFITPFKVKQQKRELIDQQECTAFLKQCLTPVPRK